METKAQELLNQVLVEERQHSDQLESKLSAALAKLEASKREVVHLREGLSRMPGLRDQLEGIQSRLQILEAGQESEQEVLKEIKAEVKGEPEAAEPTSK